jgi:hypothetical protein
MKTNDEVVVEHLREVGVVCSGWAHLEFLFEVTLCWLIGFSNRKAEGRVITSGLSLETLARKVCDLQHLKISDTKDRETLESVRERISLIVDERNLAVHGVRSADPEGDTITAELSRGKYKSKPQNLPLVRLRSLNVEIMLIITTIQPLLVRYGVIEGVTDELRPP